MKMALLAVGSNESRQAWSSVENTATARVTIVAFAISMLARSVFCCCARMTSTAFAFPALAPRIGGLLTHMPPEWYKPACLPEHVHPTLKV